MTGEAKTGSLFVHLGVDSCSPGENCSLGRTGHERGLVTRGGVNTWGSIHIGITVYKGRTGDDGRSDHKEWHVPVRKECSQEEE